MNKSNTKKLAKKAIDETGNTRGKWTVIKYTESRNGCPYWLCQCECGTLKEVSGKSLRQGKSRSCGCTTAKATLNRLSGSPEHRSWQAMKTRCYNPNASHYEFYGGRGITVCDRWRESFLNFLADMGEKPFPSASIDRYPDRNGPYSPDNCRWASKKEQSQNSRKARMITYNGETLCLLDWAKRIGITHSTLRVRLDQWTLENALTAPATPSKKSTEQILTHEGDTLSIKEWASKLEIPYSTLCYRLRNGWSIERIVEHCSS